MRKTAGTCAGWQRLRGSHYSPALCKDSRRRCLPMSCSQVCSDTMRWKEEQSSCFSSISALAKLACKTSNTRRFHSFPTSSLSNFKRNSPPVAKQRYPLVSPMNYHATERVALVLTVVVTIIIAAFCFCPIPHISHLLKVHDTFRVIRLKIVKGLLVELFRFPV